MRVLAIIQARLGSERFPRKVLADLNGKPVIQHVAERALKIRGVDQVVIACPRKDVADLETALLDSEVGVFDQVDSHEQDVLGRFVEVAQYFNARTVMRLTADCPALDPEVSSMVLQRFGDEGADFASNDVNESGYPDGFDTEVFTTALLVRAHLESRNVYEKEHVTPIMKRLAGVRSTLVRCVPRHPWADLKLSIDTPEDLARVQNLLSQQSSPRRARSDA